MTVSRWEKERAAWLREHSKPGSIRRRRAELLRRQARHHARGGAGVGESALHDDAIDPLWRQLMKSDEGSGEKLARVILVPAAYVVVWIFAGGAIGLAASLYGTLWTRAPRIGRLVWWPWVLAGAAIGMAGWLLIDRSELVTFSVWPRYFIVYFDWGGLIATWLWSQATLGLLFTGAHIYRTGWAGVPADAVKPVETNPDGSFRETPEDQLIQLDLLVDAELDEPAAQREDERDEPVNVAELQPQSRQERPGENDPDLDGFQFVDMDDEAPIFDDEPLIDEGNETEGVKTHD